MRHEELCHCEKRSDVAISRKGYLVKAMVRCFYLSAKAMSLRRDVFLRRVVD